MRKENYGDYLEDVFCFVFSLPKVGLRNGLISLEPWWPNILRNFPLFTGQPKIPVCAKEKCIHGLK